MHAGEAKADGSTPAKRQRSPAGEGASQRASQPASQRSRGRSAPRSAQKPKRRAASAGDTSDEEDDIDDGTISSVLTLQEPLDCSRSCMLLKDRAGIVLLGTLVLCENCRSGCAARSRHVRCAPQAHPSGCKRA